MGGSGLAGDSALLNSGAAGASAGGTVGIDASLGGGVSGETLCNSECSNAKGIWALQSKFFQ